MPRLDAHQHFWSYDATQYPWIPAGSPLERDWMPVDLQAAQMPLDFAGTIAIQARQTLEETRWLLGLADHAPFIRGVVGWVDLRAEDVETTLSVFAQNPKLVGVRHVVQDEPDPDFLRHPAFLRGFSQLRQFGLSYDLLIYPHQLPAAIELVRRFPEQPFVLDHLGKPRIREGALSRWREDLCELAQAPHVHGKLSGLVTEADHRHWRPEDIQPCLEAALSAFGLKRLMFGSDWPICLLAASYEQVVGLVDDFTRGLSGAEREGIFGTNAEQFYFRGKY